MQVYGTATPGAFVMVFADGNLCGSQFADSAVGLWSFQVGGGSCCSPRAGDILYFTVNGAVAPTAGAHTYVPGGSASVDFLNQ